jgi:hypothetical protein
VLASVLAPSRVAVAATFGALSCMFCLFEPRARAEDRPPLLLDWQLLREAFGAARGVGSNSTPRLMARVGVYRAGGGIEGASTDDAHIPGAPDASLVARDWGGPRLFVGHLSTVDRIRFGRSSRMLVGRVRVPLGSVLPFAQLGLGQWRIDTDLLPYRRDAVYAAQLGYGFEIDLSRFASIAFEVDHTFLYRDPDRIDPRCAHPAKLPELWASFVAATARF